MPERQTAPVVTTHAGPWERKRVRMSLEIERSGLELLAERGLDDVTVEQVAAAAGISDRTFFRYFRNVPDVLTGVPEREVARVGQLVAARPPEEDLLAAFRAVFEGAEEEAFDPDGDLKEDALRLWTDIARRDPERVSALSHAQTTMTGAFTELIAGRLGLDPVHEPTAGVLGAALAGVVWFVYLRFIESEQAVPLADMLGEAFERLGDLYRR